MMAVNAPSLAQALPAGTLPTGWNVTSGSATFVQNGTTLNINQTSQQAIANFASFSVGSGARVDISQPNSSAALLARVTGSDPSQILGQVRANGALWLINQAGIMVGPGARIDVARFIASSLNVNDSDFLANRLNFKGVGTPGDVRNGGSINAASGGSIYLVGANVSNSGSLNAPGGEVLLAAGQTVQLMDTATPGVSVVITGTPGEVKNLGQITAEAGRIGLAAGLISNSGTINASSAVREGGRIFLRASGDIKTSASSNISANGTTGGNVVLIAENAASLDGDISAIGSAGRGGYVDTSGKAWLDVVKAPVVGAGGEWHIDPMNIEIVAAGPDSGVTVAGGNVITSSESGARIKASTIVAQLDAGTNVSITTGAATPASGDITVSSAIAKTSGADAALTLNAHNNIIINADITSTAGKLDLNLNSNFQNSTPAADHAVQLNANLNLNGGGLTVSQDGGNANGTLNIAGGTTSLTGGSAIKAAAVNVLVGGTLAGAGDLVLGGTGTLTNNGILTLGTSSGYGRLAVQGKYVQGSSGVLNIKLGASDGFDVLAVDGAITVDGRLNVRGINNFVPAVGSTFNVLTAGPGSSGRFSTVNAPDLSFGGNTAGIAVTYPNAGNNFVRLIAGNSAAAAAGAAALMAAADAAARAAFAAALAAANAAALAPVAQALNSTVNIINTVTPSATRVPTLQSELTPEQVAGMPVSIPAANSGGSQQGSPDDKAEAKKDDKKEPLAPGNGMSIAPNAPVKKMYCN
ncbi:filamentous hemagglutinin N-terminal domain-containing protein [Polaromonas sp. SM01]|uniref:two-partner secretion domain-containing protein n=1 Tax=Polaromonas sp. SM01 TaxID=3085630 RepID=UPI002980D346|nr:filamentous hemagglutinin N-terminal domain-containing protein [Polaromonas sp. SM01]MDW5444500.1 filamentous hemagglutinin N-terminal domain-containing protein [Polaromonas sp. SM01]